MAHQDAPKSTLRTMLSETRSNPEHIAAFLDALHHDARVAELRDLRSSQLRTLFDVVEGVAGLGLDDIVPAEVGSLTAVRHIGRNSLPLFSAFEKRFYRTGDGAQIAGANFQTMSPVTGPGYFTVRHDAARSEILVDYQHLPTQAPADWPAIRSNETGISRLVYGHMLDTLRRVSRHVSIGSASRNGEPLGTYFVLCRQDA